MTVPPRTDPPAGLDPDDGPTPLASRRLVGPVFWAAIAFSIACLVGGAVIGLRGAALFPKSQPPGTERLAHRPTPAPPR